MGRVAGDIAEDSFLPVVGRQIPLAGSGFVIIATSAVADGCVTPIVEADLQQWRREIFLPARAPCILVDLPRELFCAAKPPRNATRDRIGHQPAKQPCDARQSRPMAWDRAYR